MNRLPPTRGDFIEARVDAPYNGIKRDHIPSFRKGYLLGVTYGVLDHGFLPRSSKKR